MCYSIAIKSPACVLKVIPHTAISECLLCVSYPSHTSTLLVHINSIVHNNHAIVVTIAVILPLSSDTCTRTISSSLDSLDTHLLDLHKQIGQPGNALPNPKQCCVASHLQNDNEDFQRLCDLHNFFSFSLSLSLAAEPSCSTLRQLAMLQVAFTIAARVGCTVL